MSPSAAPGWYPHSDESTQRWWDGTAWTGYTRTSRFPDFVERRGKVAFRGRNLFPRGDMEFARQVRRAQAILLTGVALIMVVIVGLPISLVVAATRMDELDPTWMFAVLVAVIVLAVVGLVPSIKAWQAGKRVRDAHARGEFWETFGPDGTAMNRPQFQPMPGWE